MQVAASCGPPARADEVIAQLPGAGVVVVEGAADVAVVLGWQAVVISPQLVQLLIRERPEVVKAQVDALQGAAAQVLVEYQHQPSLLHLAELLCPCG